MRPAILLPVLALACVFAAPAAAERPGWYANPSIEGAAQVGATISGNPGGIKCEPDCQGTAYEWLSCTGPGPAGADRPTGGLPFDGHPAPGCEIRVPFPGSLSYTVRPEDAGRYVQLHLTATNHDCGEVRTDGTQECGVSTGHAYSQTIGPIAAAPAPPPAPAPAPPVPAPPAPAPSPPLPRPTPQPPADPAPPGNAARPAVSGYAEEGETLTVSTGSWAGTEPISYTYRWFRCSAARRGCEAIEGATAAAYTATAADVGSRLTATVTARNRLGSMPATAPLTDRVTPSSPADGYRVVDVERLRPVHRLVITVDSPRTVRARGTATVVVRTADARGFLVKGADVVVTGPSAKLRRTTGPTGAAVFRVAVGAPKTGRVTLRIAVSSADGDVPAAARRLVLTVR